MLDRPMALSVDKIRHEMLRGILVPREMVNKALLRTYEQLDAKETKFFAHQGRITERVDVVDHGVVAAAADKIFSLAGLYAREREEKGGTPGVALEIDPVSGVIRLIVGQPAPPELSSNGVIQDLRELPPSIPSPAEELVGILPADGSDWPLPKRESAVAVSSSSWKYLTEEVVD
jgi:hypothetical protein